MTEIKIDSDLWATNLYPEGIIEKWLLPDGAFVEGGEPVAAVRVEDALHQLTAPADGWLSISVKEGSVIDPGMVLGRIGQGP